MKRAYIRHGRQDLETIYDRTFDVRQYADLCRNSLHNCYRLNGDDLLDELNRILEKTTAMQEEIKAINKSSRSLQAKLRRVINDLRSETGGKK